MAHNTIQGRYDEKPIIERNMLGSFVAHGFEEEDAEGEAIVQRDALRCCS